MKHALATPTVKPYPPPDRIGPGCAGGHPRRPTRRNVGACRWRAEGARAGRGRHAPRSI